MALTWGSEQHDVPETGRRHLGLRPGLVAAGVTGAGGEAAVHTVARSVAPLWGATRVPLLAVVAIAVAQIPYVRRPGPLTERPERSELARWIDRRTRY